MLETCLYARDLEAAERFYGGALGLEVLARRPGRHVFFRCGRGVFLVFDPASTAAGSRMEDGGLVPGHGCDGAGHAAFAVSEAELDGWRRRLARHGVEVESEVSWPGGGRSLYVRDPAGNCVELASPAVWGLSDPTPGGRREAHDGGGGGP